MTRVLFAYRFCGLGGVETSLLNKVDALSVCGVDAHVLFGEFYGSAGSSLVRPGVVSVGAEPEGVRVLLHRAFDAIVVVDWPALVPALAELNVPARVLFETHASLPAAVTRFHSALTHPLISHIVVPSRFNRQLVQSRALDGTGVTVIPNPLDVTLFQRRTGPAMPPVRMPSDSPILLWVGRLEDEKNPIDFVRLGAVLLESGYDVQFLVIGDAYSDTEYAAYTARLSAALAERWRHRLTYCRSLPNEQMADVYSMVSHSGGALVSTSLFESVPMTFLEAMACRCPVVSSAVGGVAELVIDGETGLLFPSGDLQQAVRAILSLIGEHNSPNRDAMSDKARAAVIAANSLEVVGARYKQLLDHLLGADTGRPSHTTPPAHSPAVNTSQPTLIGGMVSTIIPVYNRAALLIEAVESVLAQTYRNIEILIVDDGSTDETAPLCDRLAELYPAVRTLHVAHSGRAGVAREAGRLLARGEFIQYLDSDDLLMPTKFQVMVGALEARPDCSIAYCYTRRYRIGDVPQDVAAELTGEAHDTMLPAFIGRRYWATSTPLYRRRLCDERGPWSDLLFWEDIEYDVGLATLHPRLLHCTDWLTDMRDHDLGRLSGSPFLDTPALLAEAVRGASRICEHVISAGLTYDDTYFRSFIDDLRLFHNRSEELGMTHEADACAAMVMEATGTVDRALVGRFSLGASVDPGAAVLKLRPGEATCLSVNVVNESSVYFHGGELATELSSRLMSADGAEIDGDNPKTLFDRPLAPGESRTVDLWVRAPKEPALYYLAIDVLWAGRIWLGARSNRVSFIKLLATTNLMEPAWTLNVEPGSEAFLQIGPESTGTVSVTINHAGHPTPWHIQLNRGQVAVIAGQTYEVAFQARAAAPRPLFVAVGMAHEPWMDIGLYREIRVDERWTDFSLQFTATVTESLARLYFDVGGNGASVELRAAAMRAAPDGEPVVPPPFTRLDRLHLDIGVKPVSYEWGTDRGTPIHRYYLESFLQEFQRDIHGQCLEFQDPQYVPRFGGSRVTSIDILHIDDSNPRATIVADLTKVNDIQSDLFDCIVCTHVLHVIENVKRAVAELFRILRPDGVLLVAVPHISMYGPEFGELWRFTPRGLEAILETAFLPTNVLVRGYGNSLVAAGEIRGVVASNFLRSELDARDLRFPVEVCGRAIKHG